MNPVLSSFPCLFINYKPHSFHIVEKSRVQQEGKVHIISKLYILSYYNPKVKKYYCIYAEPVLTTHDMVLCYVDSPERKES